MKMYQELAELIHYKPTNSDYEPEWNKQIVKVMSKLPFKGAKLDKESTENELIIDIVFDITKPKKERCNVRFTITPCLRRNFLVQCKSDSTTGEGFREFLVLEMETALNKEV